VHVRARNISKKRRTSQIPKSAAVHGTHTHPAVGQPGSALDCRMLQLQARATTTDTKTPGSRYSIKNKEQRRERTGACYQPPEPASLYKKKHNARSSSINFTGESQESCGCLRPRALRPRTVITGCRLLLLLLQMFHDSTSNGPATLQATSNTPCAYVLCSTVHYAAEPRAL
jgi:hypothetical protein